MYIICPRCYSTRATRIQQPAPASVSTQLGMATLGTQLARHLPLPAPWGQLAGGLIGSLLGQAIDQHTRPPVVVFECNDCHHRFE
jgi:hypothetical protein